MKSEWAQAADAIHSAKRIVLACHVNPDGDTLGSVLALTHALRAIGKDVVPLSHGGVPEILRWMPGAEWVECDTIRRDFDLGIVCDTGTLTRIGRSREAIESATVSLTIDHHASEGEFGDIRIVDSSSAATGELIFALLAAIGAPVTEPIARCLLCAIITDTGSYRYMNVTPATFNISASLMGSGACPSAIAELVFENRSFASLKLLGRALDSMNLEAAGRIAWAKISAGDFAELDATDEETEGIVSHVRAAKGAIVGALFREVPGKQIRISLRARDGFDVNRVANVFGGGGHRLAAGCSMPPPLDQAVRKVLDEIERHLTKP